MDKVPLYWENQVVGELMAEGEALYTWFSARSRLMGQGLWCAWAVGDRGEFRLGVLEPAGSQLTIRRRFSSRMTAPLGKLLRGEVRPVQTARKEPWTNVEQPEKLFRTSWIQERLRGVRGVMRRSENGVLYVAVPYDEKRPFPLTALFCFAKVGRIGEGSYVVFAFDAKSERPVFP